MTILRGQKNILMGCGACEHDTPGVDPIARQWELDIQLTGAQCDLQVALSQGIRYTVSNGSFKDTAWAAAWIIEGTRAWLLQDD